MSPSSTENNNNNISAGFKIGAISRITNISIDTLRIWERRYGVVVPTRGENETRLYQPGDINRLTLLKMLVDRSHSIGSIAGLSDEELVQYLDDHSKKIETNKSENANKIKVAVIGNALSLKLQYYYHPHETNFEIFRLYRNQLEFLSEKDELRIDILVVEYPVIQKDTLIDIDKIFTESNAKKMVIIYGFANMLVKKMLSNTDYFPIQAPVTIDHLYKNIEFLIENISIKTELIDVLNINHDTVPPRIHKKKELIRLSSASSTIRCECPQHLSSIILRLIQFESYCLQCENQSVEDEELHVLLRKRTGHVRSIMEKTLTEVINRENKTT